MATGAPKPAEPTLVFYDGACGLCHRAVRILLRADADGRAFRFAPLGGATFDALVEPGPRQRLADRLVARTPDGRLLAGSEALVHALGRLGRGWRVAAVLLSLLPRPLRDTAYDLVARVRSRLFAKPPGICPVLAPALRKRFLP